MLSNKHCCRCSCNTQQQVKCQMASVASSNQQSPKCSEYEWMLRFTKVTYSKWLLLKNQHPKAKLEQAKSCNICYLQCIAVIIFVLEPRCYNNSGDNHGNLADHKYTELSWKSKASKFDQANQPDIAPELLLNCSQESFCRTHASWELLFYSSCLWIPVKEANQP